MWQILDCSSGEGNASDPDFTALVGVDDRQDVDAFESFGSRVSDYERVKNRRWGKQLVFGSIILLSDSDVRGEFILDISRGGWARNSLFFSA